MNAFGTQNVSCYSDISDRNFLELVFQGIVVNKGRYYLFIALKCNMMCFFLIRIISDEEVTPLTAVTTMIKLYMKVDALVKWNYRCKRAFYYLNSPFT